MSNGHVNCIIVCCPPAEKIKATAAQLSKWSGGKWTPEECMPMATALVNDPLLAFAPKSVVLAMNASYTALLAAPSGGAA